jgi:MarR family transcriptional regulator, transcriptional regulator for hemolysin
MNKTSRDFVKEPIGRIMGKISRLFLERINNQLTHLDIERSFYPLLLIGSGKGKIIQQELAGLLSCDKVQVVRIIDYLSSNGYVERDQDSKDRRKSCLRITGKAEKYLPDINKAIEETTALALKDLPEKKVDELYSYLKMIENNLISNKTGSIK